jgi:hypothetical protein
VTEKQEKKKAGIGQVAATIFFGLFAIGKKNTWQKDGATVTLFQVVVGALIGFAVVLAILITIVTLVTR